MTPTPFDPTPPQPNLIGGRSLILNGIMQSNMDAAGFQILNLDTSNLFFPSIPTQAAPPSNWFSSYDRGSMLFGFTQPAFSDIAGNLTAPQQLAITGLGVVGTGTWRADPILSDKLPTLDAIRAPGNNVNLNSNRIVNLADPINPQDAATLNILKQLAGQNPHAAVRCATTANIALIGLLTIDGVTLVAGDRVLVKNQSSTPADNRFQNGIYIAGTGAWSRASDFNDPADPPGTQYINASVFVLQGTANIGTTWFQSTPAPITRDVTNMVFVLISVEITPATISAGPGLQLVGSVMSAVGSPGRISVGGGTGTPPSFGIDIDLAYIGQDSITTLGTISTGVWHGTIIDPQHGGTGANNAYIIGLAGNFTTSLGTGPAGSSLTFALAGSTVLGLPLAGTLATLAGTETFSNKSIDAGQITGMLPIAHGGTGGTTPTSAMLALLPAQTPAAAGKKLTTDGAGNLSWT